MTDWAGIAKDVGIPLISLLGGWIGGMLRTQSRLSSLERDVSAIRDLQAKLVESVKNDVAASVQRASDDLSSRFVDKDDYNTTRQEDAKQWQQVAKALGRIEGYLEGMRKQRSGSIHDTEP